MPNPNQMDIEQAFARLKGLASSHAEIRLEDWMFMGPQTAPDGRDLHAYKHVVTRRYLYLDEEGGLWAYEPVTAGFTKDPLPADQRIKAALAF